MLCKQTAILMQTLVALSLCVSVSAENEFDQLGGICSSHSREKHANPHETYEFSDARSKQRPWRKFHENGPGIMSSHCGQSVFAFHSPLTYEVEGEGLAGIGMEVNQDYRSGHFIVKRIEPQGPAAKSNVSVGNRLLEVNGVPIDGLNMSEVVKMVRGDVGTKVRLQLQNDGNKRTVLVTRMYMAPSNHVDEVIGMEKSEYARSN